MRSSKLIYVGKTAAGAAIVAMVMDTSRYLAVGSNGDAPDMAKVVLTASSTNASGPVFNLQLTATDGLEPDRAQAEAPVRALVSKTVFKLT